MKNQITPVQNKKKFNKIYIITIIAVIIVMITGIQAYKYYSNIPPKTFVSDEDCDENYAIVFKFNEDIDEKEAKDILKNYNVNIQSFYLPPPTKSKETFFNHTINGSICIENGDQYISGTKNPLLEKMKKNEKFIDVHIEHLSVPGDPTSLIPRQILKQLKVVGIIGLVIIIGIIIIIKRKNKGNQDT